MPLIQQQPGNVYWVYTGAVLGVRGTVAGSDGNNGDFFRPFATLQKASDSCLANNGDVIMVKPGHAETISTAAILALNKAGVAIIGLGAGSLRPTLTFTAAAANIPT